MKTHESSGLRAQGLCVLTCGHSFHQWTAETLVDIAKGAGIDGHISAGMSAIGGSRAIQHWDVPEEQNIAKKALRTGKVDVLTLSCMTHPDEGIGNFAELALACNPNVRVTLQELWLPEDHFPFDAAHPVFETVDEFNGTTMDGLMKTHQPYFKEMEDYVQALNARLGRQTVFIVPDAQATMALRERVIDGKAPGLTRQSDLFLDSWGHPAPPLKALSSYCHFAVIYRCSPVGLRLPAILSGHSGWDDRLNLLLQELAWNAVKHHPLGGIVSAENSVLP